MKKCRKIISILSIGFIILVIGYILGVVLTKNYPIEIDCKIRYSELLNWVTTLIIGLIFGYYFKNRFENNKIIKNYLLEDLKTILTLLLNLKDFCRDNRAVQKFSDAQRKEIIGSVNVIDKKITVFLDLLKECDKSQHAAISDILIGDLNNFNRKLTSDGLFAEQIATNYFDEILASGVTFENNVRKITLQIIRNF